MTKIRVIAFGALIGAFACGYGVVFTVLDDFRDEYGIPARWLGAIIAVSFLSSFVAQLLFAPIADRGFARQLVFVSSVLNVAGLLMMAIGESLPVLLSGRLVSGIGIGIAGPAIRRIVINGDPGNLGSNLGLLFSADVAGFALGPAISAVMVPVLGLAAPFLATAGLTVALTIAVFAAGMVPRTPVAVTERRFAFDLIGQRPVAAAMAMTAAVAVMIGTFDALWVLVLDDMDAADWIANLGVIIFVMPLIIFGSLGGRLAQRVGPFRLGTVGVLIAAVCMFLYGVMPTAGLMLGVATAQAVSDGLTIPSAGVAVGMAATADRQAGAQGLLGATQSLTAALTALLAGWTYDAGGRVLAYTLCAGVMVLIAGLVYLLAGPTFRERPTPDREIAVAEG